MLFLFQFYQIFLLSSFVDSYVKNSLTNKKNYNKRSSILKVKDFIKWERKKITPLISLMVFSSRMTTWICYRIETTNRTIFARWKKNNFRKFRPTRLDFYSMKKKIVFFKNIKNSNIQKKLFAKTGEQVWVTSITKNLFNISFFAFLMCNSVAKKYNE